MPELPCCSTVHSLAKEQGDLPQRPDGTLGQSVQTVTHVGWRAIREQGQLTGHDIAPMRFVHVAPGVHASGEDRA
jgi:hypothetical protein